MSISVIARRLRGEFQLPLTIEETETMVRKVFELISEELCYSGRFEIKGFGTFVVKNTKKKIGYDFKHGRKIVIPPKKKVFFSPSDKILVNKREKRIEQLVESAGSSLSTEEKSFVVKGIKELELYFEGRVTLFERVSDEKDFELFLLFVDRANPRILEAILTVCPQRLEIHGDIVDNNGKSLREIHLAFTKEYWFTLEPEKTGCR